MWIWDEFLYNTYAFEDKFPTITIICDFLTWTLFSNFKNCFMEKKKSSLLWNLKKCFMEIVISCSKKEIIWDFDDLNQLNLLDFQYKNWFLSFKTSIDLALISSDLWQIWRLWFWDCQKRISRYQFIRRFQKVMNHGK
jgi:hypothetical protein